MIKENINTVKLRIKNGSLPQFTYSYINPDATSSDIYNLANTLMTLQPEPAGDETQKISKSIESVILDEE